MNTCLDNAPNFHQTLRFGVLLVEEGLDATHYTFCPTTSFGAGPTDAGTGVSSGVVTAVVFSKV